MTRAGRLGWGLLLAAVLLFMLGPLLLVVLFSFATNPVSSFPVQGVTLGWYGRLAGDAGFWSALRNSLAIALPTGLLATVTGTMAALALVGLRARPAGVCLVLVSLPVMLPPLVIGIALVVLYVRVLGVPLGLPAVIGGHLLVTQPFVVLVVMARMAAFDRACVDAARDLGASPRVAFTRVVLPQIRATLVGAALIATAISLDDFIITFFTIGGGNTLATFVWGRIRTSLDPSINAVASILMLFTVGATLIALRLSRYRG